MSKNEYHSLLEAKDRAEWEAKHWREELEWHKSSEMKKPLAKP